VACVDDRHGRRDTPSRLPATYSLGDDDQRQDARQDRRHDDHREHLRTVAAQQGFARALRKFCGRSNLLDRHQVDERQRDRQVHHRRARDTNDQSRSHRSSSVLHVSGHAARFPEAAKRKEHPYQAKGKRFDQRGSARCRLVNGRDSTAL
jgi:hypothetical protein